MHAHIVVLLYDIYAAVGPIMPSNSLTLHVFIPINVLRELLALLLRSAPPESILFPDLVCPLSCHHPLASSCHCTIYNLVRY